MVNTYKVELCLLFSKLLNRTNSKSVLDGLESSNHMKSKEKEFTFFINIENLFGQSSYI